LAAPTEVHDKASYQLLTLVDDAIGFSVGVFPDVHMNTPESGQALINAIYSF